VNYFVAAESGMGIEGIKVKGEGELLLKLIKRLKLILSLPLRCLERELDE